MMTAATKTRTALGDGYFTHEFKRVFDVSRTTFLSDAIIAKIECTVISGRR